MPRYGMFTGNMLIALIIVPLFFGMYGFYDRPSKGPVDEGSSPVRTTDRKAPRQSSDEHSQYLFLNAADSKYFWFTEYPEINEPSFLEKYIVQTEELVKYTDSARIKTQISLLIACQGKGLGFYYDWALKPHEMMGRTLSCEFLFEELNLLRDEIHKLYDEETRPYSLAKYARLTRKIAEADAMFR